ncbi:MAG TPA: asparagine synthase-related protein [Candidatus Acidoferrales bacterium]|nr:asparagine synthase-related protein [Candidatus Acidoferrales bacterium]
MDTSCRQNYRSSKLARARRCAGRKRIELRMSFPAFIGQIGRKSKHMSEALAVERAQWEIACRVGSPNMTLWARGANSQTFCHWNAAQTCPRRPMVFIWGQPLVASDCEFDAETKVERVEGAHLPDKISRLYQERGTRAFALLEGNFCLVLADPKLRSIFLAVDKFGCEDIYIRQRASGMEFASQALLLTDSSTKFNPIATAFFLAHEGFVPAPFTLFESIETVGRARFVQVREVESGICVESRRYWILPQESLKRSRKSAVAAFAPLLDSAIQTRQRVRNGILLSGGMDSALLANLIAGRAHEDCVAMTGAIQGHIDSEREVQSAQQLSSALGFRHKCIQIDPDDDELPGEWAKCCESWMGGVRITLPLFYRFAKEMKSIFGCSYGAFSGQMADTLADNNYTLASPGYKVRRMLFSPWFLRLMPFLPVIAPRYGGAAGKALMKAVGACAGQRTANMLASVLQGVQSKERFYAGRVFGFGEMPGWAAGGFPALSVAGFEMVADWYTAHFVAPAISCLEPRSFYSGMMELSMDMCMLHLDTRLVFHAFRLGGGNAELPFLDSRIVKFFANLPYSARAFYREPKYVIRKQFKRHRYSFAGRPSRVNELTSDERIYRSSRSSSSFEELLLRGTLGVYFRELLVSPSALARVPGIFEFLKEEYVERQRRAFLRGDPGIDCKFVSRLAALELWARRPVSSSQRVVPVPDVCANA